MRGSGWRCEKSAAIDEHSPVPQLNHQTIGGQSRTAGTKHAQQRGQRSGEFKLPVPISESQMTNMMSRAGLRRSVQIGRGSNTWSAYGHQHSKETFPRAR